MIRTKFSPKKQQSIRNYINLKAIRKLGRRTDLCYEQIINPKTSAKKLTKTVNQLTSKGAVKTAKTSERSMKTFVKDLKTMAPDLAEKTTNEKPFEKIVTSKIIDGKLFHLVKWRDTMKCSLIENTEANHRWPQEVIHYYQKSLKFSPKM